MIMDNECDLFFFFKQKTAYEMRISDWSSDVCSSDLMIAAVRINLVHHLDQRIVACDQNALLAIAGETHVAAVERHGRGDRRRLFAGAFHVEAGLALTLGTAHAVVEGAHETHRAQPHAQPSGRQLQTNGSGTCRRRE